MMSDFNENSKTGQMITVTRDCRMVSLHNLTAIGRPHSILFSVDKNSLLLASQRRIVCKNEWDNFNESHSVGFGCVLDISAYLLVVV